MQYLITFFEGIISFISPCMLPMLPLYISYFAVGEGRGRTFLRVCAFVLGFTVVFSAMGLFAGSIGMFLTRFRVWVNVVCGAMVVLFGLSYLEIIRIPGFGGMKGAVKVTGLFSAFLFGVIYSVSLTPCVGAFLGSALMLASTAGGALEGTLLLLVYSLGLGIPFLLSAVLIDRLADAFAFIKRHYRVINTVCGIFLIAVGLLIAAGWLDNILALFS